MNNDKLLRLANRFGAVSILLLYSGVRYVGAHPTGYLRENISAEITFYGLIACYFICGSIWIAMLSIYAIRKNKLMMMVLLTPIGITPVKYLKVWLWIIPVIILSEIVIYIVR